MAHDLTPADPTAVLELLSAFRKSQVMFTAVQLGVFEALKDGPKSPAQLAAALALNEDATVRLLGACDMLGLVQPSGNGYANTPAASAYLTGDSPERMLGYIGYSNVVLWKMWDHLPDAIREALLTRLARLGVTRENLALCSTHTHCGPCLSGNLPFIFGRPFTPEEHDMLKGFLRRMLANAGQA